MKSKQRHKNMFSLCCCHALFSQNFLQPVHDDVIAFYDVRAADIFDTIARHLAGRLLASLFTALTSYIILPAQYRHVPRQSNLGDAPMFSISPTKDLTLCRETAAAPWSETHKDAVFKWIFLLSKRGVINAAVVAALAEVVAILKILKCLFQSYRMFDSVWHIRAEGSEQQQLQDKCTSTHVTPPNRSTVYYCTMLLYMHIRHSTGELSVASLDKSLSWWV